MKNNTSPIAVMAIDIPPRVQPSVYPEPFASMMKGREKRQLGEQFGIKNFGVNLTRLAPGSRSALLHKHSLQEEFVFILEGQPTLVTETTDIQLNPGMCAGFTAKKDAHYLVNHTSQDVVYLEIGDRTEGDNVSYPADDLVASSGHGGKWHFTHKNGDAY